MSNNTVKALRDDFAEFLYNQGTNYNSQDYLGAHRVSDNTYVFRVWAPNADMVWLTGDFNGWGYDCPMQVSRQSGIWAVMLENADFGIGSRYKFIVERNGRQVYKADPYAFWSETLTQTASRFASPQFAWTDSEYLQKRSSNSEYLLRDVIPPKPMNIYEVHLGSWKRKGDGEFDYLSYRELADELSAYVLEMGYTHVELLPVAEHPFDGSWGYQVCGYFAPTSRFGKPEDFMYFVNKMHSCGIGVIMDWVPAHFPKDAHGLYEFDGSLLYEYQGADRMEHKGWGTRCFDVGRTHVQSFLISNALFWLDKYHIDGLRVDAVASMLYLDYDRKPGEWVPNEDGSRISREAVAFFQKLNAAVKDRFPDCYMIAEESTAYPNVTKRHGLGFNMKWNMGWMNDTLSYLEVDPYFRCGSHHKMTFSLTYSFNDNYVLPISHDEVVHGKKSLLDKCWGDYEAKFSTMRAYLTYMITHPGKKLTFMGCEYGPFREWNYKESLEWFMLGYEKHSAMKKFVADLNHLYASVPALHEKDCEWDGFSWIFADNTFDNIYAYERIAIDGSRALVVLNFSGSDREEYKIPLLESGWYHELINTDSEKYGGKGYINGKAKRTVKNAQGGNELTVKLPAFGAAIFSKKAKKGDKKA